MLQADCSAWCRDSYTAPQPPPPPLPPTSPVRTHLAGCRPARCCGRAGRPAGPGRSLHGRMDGAGQARSAEAASSAAGGRWLRTPQTAPEKPATGGGCRGAEGCLRPAHAPQKARVRARPPARRTAVHAALPQQRVAGAAVQRVQAVHLAIGQAQLHGVPAARQPARRAVKPGHACGSAPAAASRQVGPELPAPQARPDLALLPSNERRGRRRCCSCRPPSPACCSSCAAAAGLAAAPPRLALLHPAAPAASRSPGMPMGICSPMPAMSPPMSPPSMGCPPSMPPMPTPIRPMACGHRQGRGQRGREGSRGAQASETQPSRAQPLHLATSRQRHAGAAPAVHPPAKPRANLAITHHFLWAQRHQTSIQKTRHRRQAPFISDGASLSIWFYYRV